MYTFEFSIMKNLKIAIINGPNLNLLGKREPEIYGQQSFEEYLVELKRLFPMIELNYFQSNIEGEIVNCIQDADEDADGILLNAGGYTHTSVAIADAVAAIKTKVIEVHISQPAAREVERHTSLLAKYSMGSISGFGLQSYYLGLTYFKNTLNEN
tara:strand:- start:951 stop:1415 length:465 start_codon:yes stop_codon:yes gene_type:complete